MEIKHCKRTYDKTPFLIEDLQLAMIVILPDEEEEEEIEQQRKRKRFNVHYVCCGQNREGKFRLQKQLIRQEEKFHEYFCVFCN